MIFPCTTLTLKEAELRLALNHQTATIMDDLRGFLDRKRFMWEKAA